MYVYITRRVRKLSTFCLHSHCRPPLHQPTTEIIANHQEKKPSTNGRDTECHLAVNKISSLVHLNAARVAGVGCSLLIDRRERNLSLRRLALFTRSGANFETSFSHNANPSVELTAPVVCFG
ncbi:hypothetical protein TNCV_4240851 [Trichonephila clavipes]|nr:hypothetical protein TNCV_4240851 [Trichonephila clavipes]